MTQLSIPFPFAWITPLRHFFHLDRSLPLHLIEHAEADLNKRECGSRPLLWDALRIEMRLMRGASLSAAPGIIERCGEPAGLVVFASIFDIISSNSTTIHAF